MSDASGNLFVVGLTQSSDFPNVSSFQSTFGGDADGFIAKISADGTKVLYASFLGGPGYDFAQAVAIDAAGNAYVAGQGGAGLPMLAPSFGTCLDDATNAFLVKVTPAGDHLMYAGCLGGSGSVSEGTAVAVDAAGNAYLGGDTNAADFPLTTGAFDGLSQPGEADFVVKVSNRWIQPGLFRAADGRVVWNIQPGRGCRGRGLRCGLYCVGNIARHFTGAAGLRGPHQLDL